MVKKRVTKKKNNDLSQKILVNYFDKTKYRAIIYNSNGEQVTTIKLDRAESKFYYKDKLYNIKWDAKSFFKREDFFNKYKYFHYDISNPDPVSFPKYEKPKFDSEMYNQIFNTKVAKDLNNATNNKIQDLLTPKNILIGVAIIGVIYYFGTGGTLT